MSIISGSGNLVENKIGHTHFDAVTVSGPFDLTITHSDYYDITIVADHNVMSYVSVDRNGDELSIELSPYYSFENVTLKAYVNMPNLKGIRLAGATTATVIDSASFPYQQVFTVNVSGASKLLIPSMSAYSTTVQLSGASTVTAGVSSSVSVLSASGASELKLIGYGGDITADVLGASELDMRDAESKDVTITVDGASRATINMNGRLDAVIAGASTLNYRGDVVLGSLDITGASQFSSY